jgi:hypothetical protein
MSDEIPEFKPPKKRSIMSPQELIGAISAGTGIFAALLYLAGRSYAGGYFDAMNIPHYMVTFSIWEYGEVGWFPMLLYPLGMMILGSLFWTVFYGLSGWLSPLGAHLRNWIKKRIKIKWPTWKLPETSLEARRAFKLTKFMFVILAFIMIAIYTLQFVRDLGVINGQFIVLEKAAKVELVSAIPMTLDNASLVTTQAEQNVNQFYVYKGFHLLTVNGGKYYLFKEIDPVTCKPLHIYVIDADQYKQVNLLAAESLSSQCQKDKSPQVIPTPTATPVIVP